MDFDTQQKIKDLRENLGRSITAARDFAAQQRENPARHSEFEEKFRRAHQEATAIKNELQALEMQDAAEQHVEPSLRGFSVRESRAPSSDTHSIAFGAYLRAHAQDGAIPMSAMERAAGVGPDEINAMLSSDDELGGFAVPEDFRSEILRDLAGRVVVRAAGARVVQTSGKEVFWPAISGSAEADPNDNKMYTSQIQKRSANWKAEGHTVGGASIPTQTVPLGGERIPINLWQPDVIEVTRELLADSAGNLEAALKEAIRETRALDEDYAFLLGSGVGEPEGILSSSNSVARVNVGDASTYATPAAGDNGISYPRMVNIYTDLAAQYRRNATWVFNSDTFGLVLKVEDADARPLFPLNQLPDRLLNRPFLVTEFLPNLDTDGNEGLIFGDFQTGYVIAERRDLVIQRLVERYAPNVGLLPTARVGGGVVRSAAFRVGTTQA